MSSVSPSHRWRFFRTGGLDQVRIERGADLEHLEHLDQKLWVALACPVKGLEFDERTLALIDSDGDARVRASEVIAAVAFCKARLKSLDSLIARAAELPLSAIDPAKPDGAATLTTAQGILSDLGKADAANIGLGDIADTSAIFAQTRFNGDGVIIPTSTDDAALTSVIADAVKVTGGKPDRSAITGVDQAQIDTFFAELSAVDAWTKRGEDDAATLLPLGDATAAAAAAYTAVVGKIDDFFARCRLAGFDPRTQALIDHPEGDYAAILSTDLSADASEVAGFPLAKIEAGKALPLADQVNPAWVGPIDTFSAQVVTPLLGTRDALTEDDWRAIQGKLAPHLAWVGEKPSTAAHDLGVARVREILAAAPQAALAALVAKDASFAGVYDGIQTVEKLIRLHRDLFGLAKNFVSFQTFYAREEMAVFQAGTLYLDSRSCELCVRVNDAGKHAALAGLSKCFLAYCDCTRPGGEKMQIAAVFGGGDSDYLMVGRNGVFYDRQGRDWDATITRIVDNPISIRQAFFSPYKKFIRFVEEQVTKRAAAADANATAKLGSAAETTATADKAKPPPAKFDLGTIALIGVAVSGAAAVIGGLLEAFFGLGMWMPIGLAGLVLLISGPSMIIAALKLRQRNLGPILDANGWAVNGRVKLNIPFGGSLTKLPVFPDGSERTFVDPYQQKKSPWVFLAWAVVLVGLLFGASAFGYHQGWLPSVVESPLSFLGVPKHLVKARDVAQSSVDEAKAVVTSAQEQASAASQTLADLVAAEEPEGPRLARARARLDRSEAKLVRAQDRLDRVESRLEAATEALEAAIDRDEARTEAAASDEE